MKLLVGTVAVLGALAIGGIPAVAFTLAQADHGLGSESSGDSADHTPGNGPPEWAHSGHHGDKGDKGEAHDEGRGWGPWKDKANEHAWEMSARGRAHGEAMREWAACVSEHAANQSDDSGFDPEVACGTKPIPPGHLKHDAEVP
jgi:hypothetical protein